MSDAERIKDALRRRSLDALRLYETALAGPGADDLKRRFGATMALLASARDLDLEALPRLYAGARGDDRRRMREVAVDRLLELRNDRAALHGIGARFPRLVLEGSLQQRFCCRLAADLGLRTDVHGAVVHDVMVPLIEALRVVLRVGAPITRDAAIEGLGALLKHFPDPASAFVPDEELPLQRERDERAEDFEARRAIVEEYFDRLRRRRLMVLTVAGDEQARNDFAERLEEPMIDAIARLRREEPDSTQAIGDALWERSDLLRILPAVARQRGSSMLSQKPADLLIGAAQLLSIEEGDRPEVAIAFARYRESVFRTIDTALRRGWKWKKFDDVVAEAVRAIPQTVAGSPAMCNAEIRATVAIVRTAVRLLKHSKEAPSSTRAALEPLFERLRREPTPWANHGVAEGCFRELPALLHDPLHNDMIRPALFALFALLREVPPPDDFVKVHRRLTASSCFRRILLSLTDHLQERQMFEEDAAARSGLEQVDRQLRVLLRFPTIDNLRDACQQPGKLAAGPVRMDVAEPVIAGIAFESDLLRGSVSLFNRWPHLSTVDKVLLTRILAAQLHAISRDMPALRRHDVLRRVFAETPGVSIADPEVMQLAWELLSSLPAEAADAADMEIQRFVEYRGRAAGEDLPGHVLAMISPVSSGRIAGAIAREIDLNLRHERGHDSADCAKSLYQVMLRGPHESIFEHLLPRVSSEQERSTVMLFRRHVANVRRSSHDAELDLGEILDHVDSLLKDLEHSPSKVLQDLRNALTLYRGLASLDENVWKLIVAGETVRLFTLFDTLAAETDVAKQGLRKQLASEYERRLRKLQDDITHYVTLPVGNFTARRDALTKAIDVAHELQDALSTQAGLQPPERILLVALMQRFHRLFAATIRWYCDEPRRRIDEKGEREKAKDEFWLFFCDPRPPAARFRSLARLVRSGPQAADVVAQLTKQDEVARFKRLIGTEPPPFAKQRDKFEEFFVEWMASDLDVDTLEKNLAPRWPRWFKAVYSTITNFTRMVIVILLLCGWAIVMDLLGLHWLEGASFFLASFVVIMAAFLSFTRGVHRLAQWAAGQTGEEEKPGYWFSSLLPRLARLTAVPMALIVEFDHSYEFPLAGSTWVLMLLMILSYLTTRFFVTREIVDQKEDPGVVRITEPEKKRVAQIVALALAHAFGIAVLLSSIFASSHHHTPEEHEATAHALHADVHWSPPLALLETVLQRFDEVPGPHHFYPRFLGILPRDVKLDFSTFMTLPPTVEKHAVFTFYPTIILTWTALGLFFGVFLEGFMEGKRIRGGAKAEAAEGTEH